MTRPVVVLNVNDDAPRYLLSSILKRAGTVEEASNGLEAVARARHAPRSRAPRRKLPDVNGSRSAGA